MQGHARAIGDDARNGGTRLARPHCLQTTQCRDLLRSRMLEAKAFEASTEGFERCDSSGQSSFTHLLA
jgi:hypothetical protein